jgi:hypothetical protein
MEESLSADEQQWSGRVRYLTDKLTAHVDQQVGGVKAQVDEVKAQVDGVNAKVDEILKLLAKR